MVEKRKKKKKTTGKDRLPKANGLPHVLASKSIETNTQALFHYLLFIYFTASWAKSLETNKTAPAKKKAHTRLLHCVGARAQER